MSRLSRPLLLLLLALGGGCATTGSDRPVSHGPECAGLDAFTELARSAGHIVDVMYKHPGAPDAAAAELDAYATEREPVTRCLRGMLPALNDRMDDDPGVLSDYARKVGPVVQRTAQAQKDMPEMFEHDGLRRAIQRLH